MYNGNQSISHFLFCQENINASSYNQHFWLTYTNAVLTFSHNKAQQEMFLNLSS